LRPEAGKPHRGCEILAPVVSGLDAGGADSVFDGGHLDPSTATRSLLSRNSIEPTTRVLSAGPAVRPWAL
jgi:hypothetical protein